MLFSAFLLNRQVALFFIGFERSESGRGEGLRLPGDGAAVVAGSGWLGGVKQRLRLRVCEK